MFPHPINKKDFPLSKQELGGPKRYVREDFFGAYNSHPPLLNSTSQRRLVITISQASPPHRRIPASAILVKPRYVVWQRGYADAADQNRSVQDQPLGVVAREQRRLQKTPMQVPTSARVPECLYRDRYLAMGLLEFGVHL